MSLWPLYSVEHSIQHANPEQVVFISLNGRYLVQMEASLYSFSNESLPENYLNEMVDNGNIQDRNKLQ